MVNVSTPDNLVKPVSYRASQELADILVKHGFEETTAKQYPQHFLRFQDKPYNPDGAKRSFKHPACKTHWVMFDYINMQLIFRNAVIEHETRFSADQIKALLTLFKISTADRRNLHNRGQIQRIIDIVNREPLECFPPTAFELRVKKVYNSLEI